MFYAKLDAQKKVERYPYTLTDLKWDTPGTSFPAQIDEATIVEYGLVAVKPTTPPEETYTTNLTRTAVLEKTTWGETWVEKWVAIPATPEQIKERTDNRTNQVREERNQRLADCDWTQLNDAPVDAKVWATHRQALRDLTKQSGFPWEITWPDVP